MTKWKKVKKAPIGQPVIVRYMNKWVGDNIFEHFEAEFDGSKWWRRNCMWRMHKHKYAHNFRMHNGNLQEFVYENSINCLNKSCAVVGWIALPPN